jgi:hypothetical protein
VSNPSQSTAAFASSAKLFAGGQNVAIATEPVSRFHAEHPSLAAELPHHNARNGATLHTLDVTCDDCGTPVPLGILHGVINDYAHCTEVRYAGTCPQCERTVQNVLRVSGNEMRFIKAGQWCVATRRPWWHCLWPWPIDREW